jgi:acetyl esterase/lipase
MRQLAAVTLILLGAGFSPAPAAPPRDGVREVLDVRYHDTWSTRHKLDVFAPGDLKPGEKRPVVIFAHGGTWMAGDKNFFGVYREVGRGLAEAGVVAVMINYRLSPLVRHPEHVKDAARAFAWVRDRIGKHGGDPDRIFLAGHSAGAHLMTLLATDDCYLKDPKLYLDEKDFKAVRGVIPICGVYRIPDADEFKVIAKKTVDHLVGAPGTGRLASTLNPTLMCMSGVCNPFAWVFGKDCEANKQASPLSHVRAGLPPFLMINAEAEVAGLHAMAAEYLKELKKHGVPVEHHEIEGTTHRTVIKKLYSADEDLAKLVAAFVKRHAG